MAKSLPAVKNYGAERTSPIAIYHDAQWEQWVARPCLDDDERDEQDNRHDEVDQRNGVSPAFGAGLGDSVDRRDQT